MKVITWETLYYEDHGATLKHKCGKRIVALPLFNYFLFWGAFFFLWPFSPFLGQCSIEWWSSHFYLFTTRKIITRYLEQNMTLCECLRRCTGICSESRATCMKIMKVALPQIPCQLHDHAKSNMTMTKRVIINGTVESCMAIYLGMPMEMP